MINARIISSILKIRYVTIIIAPLLTVITVSFSMYFTSNAIHHIVLTGNSKTIYETQRQQWPYVGVQNRWVIHLQSENQNICNTSKNSYLWQFNQLFTNGLEQLLYKINYQLDSLVNAGQNNISELESVYCSKDQHGSFYYLMISNQNQSTNITSMTLEIQSMIKEIENTIKYTTNSDIEINILSPVQQALRAYDMFYSSSLIPVILFMLISMIFLCLVMHQMIIFMIVLVLNSMYIFSISMGLDYFIEKGFKQSYSSYIYVALMCQLIISQILYGMKAYYILEKNKNIYLRVCEAKIKQLQQQNFIKNQTAIIQQVRQGITLPQETDNQIQTQLNTIRYKTVLQTLFTFHNESSIQQMYSFVFQLAAISVLWVYGLEQFNIICVMGYVQIGVQLIINYLHTLTFLSIFIKYVMKNNDFEIKYIFKYNTCYQYLSHLEENKGTTVMNQNEQGDDENLFSIMAKKQGEKVNDVTLGDISFQLQLLEDKYAQETQSHLLRQKLQNQLFYRITSKFIDSKTASIIWFVISLVCAIVFSIANYYGKQTFQMDALQRITGDEDYTIYQDFQKQFYAGYMDPVQFYMNFNKSICQDQYFQAAYAAIYQLLNDAKNQFQNISNLVLRPEQIQCPFIIDNLPIYTDNITLYDQILINLTKHQDVNATQIQIDNALYYNYTKKMQQNNYTQLYCNIYQNFTLNGEYYRLLVPFYNSQEKAFNKLFETIAPDLSVKINVLNYQTYLYDLDNQIHFEIPFQYGLESLIIYAIASIFSLSFLGLLSFLLIQQLMYWFSKMVLVFLTSVIKIFPHDVTINPIISIAHFHFVTYLLMDITFFSYKSFKDEFMHSKNFNQAIKSIQQQTDFIIQYLKTFLASLISLFFIRIQVITQLVILFEAALIILILFLLPATMYSTFVVFGYIQFWPYKQWSEILQAIKFKYKKHHKPKKDVITDEALQNLLDFTNSFEESIDQHSDQSLLSSKQL